MSIGLIDHLACIMQTYCNCILPLVSYTVPSVFYNVHVCTVLGGFLQVGKEAETHVWDASSMRTVSVLKGFHRRGVICVDFSGILYKRCKSS